MIKLAKVTIFQILVHFRKEVSKESNEGVFRVILPPRTLQQ